jgi:hypothetical protein
MNADIETYISAVQEVLTEANDALIRNSAKRGLEPIDEISPQRS